MNAELFITRRILKHSTLSFSTPVVKIAVFSIAVCVAVMIISLAVVFGFKQAIQEKIIGFGSHITISNFDDNSSYESSPIDKNRAFINILRTDPAIKQIQVFATKAGVIKANGDIQGVVLKGIDKSYDWSFFSSGLIEGEVLTLTDTGKSNDIMISQSLASKLALKLHDKIDMFFIQDPPRMRKFRIAGIFNSGMESFDQVYVLADIKHIQKLNDWSPSQVAGFEVLLNDIRTLDNTAEDIYSTLDSDLQAQTIKEEYPQLFDWLRLIDTNGIVILVIMMMVAAITMISTLLILILERTNMIGILKAIGTPDVTIRRIFILKALYITGSGILWGTLVAVCLCLLQQHLHLIKLDQASYYVSYVPVAVNAGSILILDLATLVVGILVLLIPSYVISRIDPIKAIRYQ